MLKIHISKSAKEGIIWLSCILTGMFILAMLCALGLKYEDEKRIEEMNRLREENYEEYYRIYVDQTSNPYE